MDFETDCRFGSLLEGCSTQRLSVVEAAAGSRGKGLSVGMGITLNAKHLDKPPYRTYVLLGDSEMAERSQWEAVAGALADTGVPSHCPAVRKLPMSGKPEKFFV